MKICQTTKPEPIRSIAQKHSVPVRELASLTGLSPRSIVPAGVSLLLPLGARGGGAAGRIYPDTSEERSEILVIGEEPRFSDSSHTGSLLGMALCSGGTLTQRGLSRLHRCPTSEIPICLRADAWSGECPAPSDLAELLIRAGYCGLLLPLEQVAEHRLIARLPDMISAFSDSKLTFAVTLQDKAFLRHLPLFSCFDPLPDFFRLTPSSWELPLEVRVREIAESADLMLRRRILLSLPTGAAFTTHEKSAPLPYGEALRIVLSTGVVPRREDILMAPVKRGKGSGTVYLEDPVSLLAGLMRLSASNLGGVSLSGASAPFAGEMIRRLFRTAGGKEPVHFHK